MKDWGTRWLKSLLKAAPRLREMPYLGLWLSRVMFDTYVSIYYVMLEVGTQGIPLAWIVSRLPDFHVIPLGQQLRLIDRCASALPAADRPVLLRGCEPCSVGLVTHVQERGWFFELLIPPDTVALFATGGSMPVHQIPLTVGAAAKVDKVSLRDTQSSTVADLVVARPDAKPTHHVVTNLPIDCLQLVEAPCVTNGLVRFRLDHQL